MMLRILLIIEGKIKDRILGQRKMSHIKPGLSNQFNYKERRVIKN